MSGEDFLHFGLCEWLNNGSNRDLRFTSNIIERIAGKRARIQASKLSSKAHKHPDILITTPIGKYRGLALELKDGEDKLFTKKGVFRLSLSDTTYPHIRAQYHTLIGYAEDGYFSSFACSMLESKRIIQCYVDENNQYLDSTARKYNVIID